MTIYYFYHTYGLQPIHVLPRMFGSLAISIRQSICSSTSRNLFFYLSKLLRVLPSGPATAATIVFRYCYTNIKIQSSYLFLMLGVLEFSLDDLDGVIAIELPLDDLDLLPRVPG